MISYIIIIVNNKKNKKSDKKWLKKVERNLDGTTINTVVPTKEGCMVNTVKY